MRDGQRKHRGKPSCLAVAVAALAWGVLAAGCDPGREGETTGGEVSFRVVFLGDSLTDGYHLDRSKTYPALVAARMAWRGWPVTVENAGVSGDTSADALRRLGPLLREPVDVLVVALGTNDVLGGIPLSELERNLQGILDRTRARSPAVRTVIAGASLDASWSAAYASALGDLYRRLAERNGAGLIPALLEGVGGDPDLLLPDGVHPTGEGHRVMADTVWACLEPILEEVCGRGP